MTMIIGRNPLQLARTVTWSTALRGSGSRRGSDVDQIPMRRGQFGSSSSPTSNVSFWQDLREKVGKGKITVFAPMDEVTDTSYRQTILHFNKFRPPHAIWTEFINCEGVFRGSRSSLDRMNFDPISEGNNLIVQVWGSDPDTYKKVGSIVLERGFKGLDINMGCPMEKVQSQAGGCCSALIEDPKRAQEIVIAAREGVENKIPVSVKTRLGLSKIQTESWVSSLLQVHPSLITLHARTAKQMSKPPLHWNELRKAVQLRDDISPSTLLFGNGDIQTVEEGEKLSEDLGLDGFMIGRGVFEVPQAFLPASERRQSQSELGLEVLVHHWLLVCQHSSPTDNTSTLYALKRFRKVLNRSYLPLLKHWLKNKGHSHYLGDVVIELSRGKTFEELRGPLEKLIHLTKSNK